MKIEHEPFKLFKTTYFIETGTYLGEGVESALELGFREIYSIEIKKDLFENAVRRFHDYLNVHIIEGDSGYILLDIIKDIPEQITFFLDGHYSYGITGHGVNWCPLWDELDQISKHPIKNHNIIIDDWRLWNGGEWDLTRGDIIDLIYSINQDYQISFMPHIVKQDILIAQI